MTNVENALLRMTPYPDANADKRPGRDGGGVKPR